MEALEPFEMSDEKMRAIESDRLARKEWEEARYHDHADQLRSVWE